MEKQFILSFPYENKVYPIYVTRRRTHRYSIRVLKDGRFSLSIPNLTSKSMAKEVLSSLFPKLMHSIERKKGRNIPQPYGEDFLYELGEKHEHHFVNDEERLSYIKNAFLPIIKDRVTYYEKVMKVTPPYKVILRNMSSEWGSNSKKTHRLAFSLSLYYFPLEAIDSVVVHELAHHFQMNHSSKFYKIVYEYNPEYDYWHSKLRKKEYARIPNLEEK